jgi:hypothetical protein
VKERFGQAPRQVADLRAGLGDGGEHVRPLTRAVFGERRKILGDLHPSDDGRRAKPM